MSLNCGGSRPVGANRWIWRISATGEPNQRIAAGWIASVIQRSSIDTIGQASVGLGLTSTGPIAATGLPRDGPSRGSGS